MNGSQIFLFKSDSRTYLMGLHCVYEFIFESQTVPLKLQRDNNFSVKKAKGQI